jgi:hypothetical protein
MASVDKKQPPTRLIRSARVSLVAHGPWGGGVGVSVSKTAPGDQHLQYKYIHTYVCREAWCRYRQWHVVASSCMPLA